MRIKIRDANTHTTHPGLDQAAREQEFSSGLRPLAGDERELVRDARRVALDHLRVFLLKVHRRRDFAGGEEAVCLLGKLVECVHVAGRIQLARQLVEGGEQLEAVVEPAGGDFLDQVEPRLVIGAEFGELDLHAGLELAFEQVRDIRAERIERRAEEAGACGVARQRAPLHQIDERRHGVLRRTEQLVDHAAHRRPATEGLQIFVAEPGHALEGIVSALRANQRAQEHRLVGDRCHLRH